MLKNVSCSNYRSFDNDIVFNFYNGLNVIIGENNSGKTNLLRMLEVILTRLRNHTQIQSSVLKQYQNESFSIDLPPETNPLSEEEYFNKNTIKPIDFGIVFDLENNNDFIYNLKEALENTEASKRNLIKRSEIDKLNNASKELKISFKINAISKDKRFLFNSNMTSEKDDQNILQEKKSQNETVSLDKILKFGFDYDKFSKFMMEYIIMFPEFRFKPGKNTNDHLQSPSGEELNNVLYNLKNGSKPQQDRFERIKETFYCLFNFEFLISKQQGPRLTFYIKELDMEISQEGIGAGVIQMLNILTHIIEEKNKIFIIDEPELNLHPHKKRILLDELKKSAKYNQIIFTTHSSDFIDMEQINKVNLIKIVKGRSRVTRCNFKIKDDEYMKNFLLRLKKYEQKEFFFAQKVLLVEGETEFGAIPKFAENYGYDFNINSVSIIPIQSSYFLGMIRILKEFEIPFMILNDSDTLLNIKGKINCDCIKVRTSSIFHQFDKLDLLSNEDKSKIMSFENNMIKIPSKKRNSTDFKFLSSLQNDQDVPVKIRDQAKNVIKQYIIDSYDRTIESILRSLIDEKSKESKIKIKILESDFEGIFKSKYKDLLDKSNEMMGLIKFFKDFI
jgi:putative ATP-dependent endonuclease of OLD family